MSGNIWAWVGLSWTDRIRLVLNSYGDRITDISIFGWRVGIDGTLSQTFNPAQLDEYRAKWPHIRWWGCFRNMDDPANGPRAIFDALRDSATARNKLADEVASKMFAAYPWLHGVDLDMESGGDYRQAESEEIFRVVTNRAHALGKKASGALPGLTATGSVGGENWVRYKQLGEILDHVSIMSYDFAWNGSAPGPISPAFWLEDVYNWATTQVDPAKISMGLPLYGRSWYLHDTPENRDRLYRGVSGTYYIWWQYFTGARAWDDAGITHEPTGWLAYRDPSSRSLWGLPEVYDWKYPQMWEAAQGVFAGSFQERAYTVRYGQPAGTPIWSLADNSVGNSYTRYLFNCSPVTSAAGEQISPKRGYTLTTELLQRDPIAATIIDDYATSAGQLGTVYVQPSGSWSFTQISDTYKQYRGTGTLQFNRSFGTQSLYALARFQFATAGRFSVYSQGITADLHSNGELRLLRGSTVLATAQVGAQRVGGAAQVGRCVLALRVREGSARVYFSNAETSIPLRLEAKTTPPGGTTGYTSTGTAWIDHTYLGDGWNFMPREAVEVTLNGQTHVMGRIPRTGVTWNPTINTFRPNTDIEERETRDRAISPDWDYAHLIDAPISTGVNTEVTIKHLDHDVWLGNVYIGDRDGFSTSWWSDAETVLHWRDRAAFDWGMQGIAMWSLGQEDVRLWPALQGGHLTPELKRLDE